MLVSHEELDLKRISEKAARKSYCSLNFHELTFFAVSKPYVKALNHDTLFESFLYFLYKVAC